MMRLFIALPIPKNMRAMLHRMGCSLPSAKPLPEEQVHLTLRFIGDVEGSTFLDIKEGLTSVHSPSLDLVIQGVGHFPPRGKPRVIWAGVQPVEPVIKLNRKVNSCLKSCGVAPDTRKFSPHITLARLKNTPVKRVTEFLVNNAFLNFPEFNIECFHLYSSRLSSKGAVHTLESTYALQNATNHKL